MKTGMCLPGEKRASIREPILQVNERKKGVEERIEPGQTKSQLKSQSYKGRRRNVDPSCEGKR